MSTATATHEPTATAALVGRTSHWWGLAVLMVLALLVVLDKQVFVLQIEPIRKALALSDFQLGLVQGLSVALFAAFAGYPIAWIADRFEPRVVLAACVAAWSVSVALTGLSTSFAQMFVFSALVGAGEAGLLPISYAYIARVFEGPRRVLANSVFMAVGRFSSGFVIAASGYVVANAELARSFMPSSAAGLEAWRLAFIVAALLGIPLALLVFTIPLTRAPRAANLPGAPAPRVLPFVKLQRAAFFTFWIGLGISVFGYTAFLSFAPVVAMRQFGATPVEVGNAMGAATLAATVVGLLATNLGVKWLSSRVGDRVPVLMLAAAAVLGCIPIALVFFASTSTQLFVLLGVQMTFLMAGAMLFPTAIQDMAPPLLRARLISIVILVNTVLSAVAPVVVGAISDALKPRTDSLMIASASTAIVALLASTALLLWCARFYPAAVAAARSWQEPPP